MTEALTGASFRSKLSDTKMKVLAALFLATAFLLGSCTGTNRPTAGIADEYGMLSVDVPKEKRRKQAKIPRLKSIGEQTDPGFPEW